ncbi:unnamed protein product [Musa banksii]
MLLSPIPRSACPVKGKGSPFCRRKKNKCHSSLGSLLTLSPTSVAGDEVDDVVLVGEVRFEKGRPEPWPCSAFSQAISVCVAWRSGFVSINGRRSRDA